MKEIMSLFGLPQGVPDKKVALPTVPESPAFALRKRVHVEHKVEQVGVQTQPSPSV